jgi:4-aminobutyrate aminotransferase-like enzyme/Ser/Thr protein kinase RdoA (MazF antagonist)
MAPPDDATLAHYLREIYSLAGDFKVLPGELDTNFKVSTGDGRRFLLRIHAPDAAHDEVELQTAVLQFLEQADPLLAVQRVVPSISGAVLPTVTTPDGTTVQLRLTTWLDGDVWATSVPAPRGARATASASLGRLLARLDRALEDFDHPAADRAHRWDLARAGEQLPSVSLIDEPSKRDVVASVLNRFVDHVGPRLADLPRQTIHNDANDYNVLLGADHTVSGLIDFGDIVRSWRINEIAVACAYAMIGAPDAIGAVLPLVAAYHDENPLNEIEVDVLFDLILTRYAMSICMAATQIRDNPANTYLLISQHDVWERLQHLTAQNRRIAIMRFRAACRYEAAPNRPHIDRWLQRNGHQCAPVFARDFSPQNLRVLDLTEPTGVVATEVLAGLAADADSAHIVAIGRYGENRSMYRTKAFETADPDERRTIHVGIDLFAPAGERVLAPLDATVVDVGVETVPLGFGGIAVLQHETDDGVPFFTLYGHLSPESLESLTVGRTISRGDVVARLGRPDENGGWEPHLHFQLMTDLCGWTPTEIIGVVAASGWDVWSSVFLNPNLVLGLATDCSVVVERDAQWLQRERRYVLGRSLSLAYDTPLKIVRGEGVHLIDDRGDRYLDMVNNVCHVGHCHPRIVAAGQRQMATLNTNSRYLHDSLVQYSRRLTATMPPELSVVFMVNSGSEANDLALRLARTYTGNRDVITVDHVYHGNLSSIIEISPYKFAGPGGDGRRDHVWVTEMPDLYRGRIRYDQQNGGAGVSYASRVGGITQEMQRVGQRPAAFFSEGILGTGGMLVLPEGYLQHAYAHVREAGGVCVADEVQIGFGRVGTHMWAFETQGVVPDIVTMGKPIGNGHPMAAVVTTPAIASAFANGMEYFSTFGGNPVSAEIGLAVLDVIRDERLMHNAATVGEQMMTGVRQLAERHRVIGDVRGHGLFIGVELVRDRDTLEPADTELNAVVEAMKQRHVLLSTEGPHHNVLKVKPPIVFSSANCTEFLEKFDDVLSAISPA